MQQETVSQPEPASFREQRKATYKKICKWLWIATIFGVFAVAGLFLFLSFQDLPTFEDLENPKNNLASEVYAANGEVLGRYYVENRVPVSYEELSPFLTQALISTEDERYLDHSGIDAEALARVAFKTVLMGQRSKGGGSTITQQLAKLLYPRVNTRGMNPIKKIWKLLSIKLKEWITAVKLERSYTKEEIIAMYLNKFNFINGAYGIRAASEIYFGQTQDSLKIEEAATLVGMLKNPALFNPVRRPDTTAHRRMVVLYKMMENKIIAEAEYDSLKVLPMDMSNFNRKTHADGLAPYFRMELRKTLMSILRNKDISKPNGDKYDIFRDGLKIYTTLDPVIQAHAEAAMLEHMESQQKKFFKRWKNKDPWTYKEEETTEANLKARQLSLNARIRESDRYQSLHEKYLSSLIQEIKKDIDGYELKDYDIVRIIAEEDEGGSIAKLVAQEMISSNRAVKFRKVLRNQKWPELREQWDALQKEVKKVFDKKVPMRVFAYNDKMEKDTVMSPLDSIKYHRMFLQFGSIAVDPVTGHVKAWVGGINHKYFQFDHVTSERQVGSTFKPFIYATAVDQGISPCFEVYDIPYTIHKGEGYFNLLDDWTPDNADGEYSGNPYTLIRGLMHSKNTVSVYLMKQLGSAEPVRNIVRNMGIDVDHRRGNGTIKVPSQPSICLGSSDLTVYELTGAYTTFANGGIYNRPIFISRIVDKNGRTIYQELPEDHPALEPKINYVMVQMLKSVMRQGLPGFNGLKSEIGGKTGTTNDYVDGWFMGITPDLVVGTWVGGEDQWVRFLTLQDGIGARMARPFFAKLLQRLENDPEADYDKDARFVVPSGDIGIELDCSQYRGNHNRPDEEFGEEVENETFGDDIFGDEDDFDEEPSDSTNIDEGFDDEF